MSRVQRVGLTGTARFVVIGRSVHLEQTAGTPDGYIPLTTDRVDLLALMDRPLNFQQTTSSPAGRQFHLDAPQYARAFF